MPDINADSGVGVKKPRFPDARLYLLAVSTSILLILSYPKPSLGFFAWFALAPLTYAILKAADWRKALLLGFISGLVFYSGILYWIYFTCRAGELSVPLSILCWLLLSSCLALEWVLFAWLAHLFARTGPGFAFGTAVAWTLIEWLKVLLAQKAAWFPWFLLAYTQWNYTTIIQVVSVTGPYGLSFAIAFLGISAGWYFYQKKPISGLLSGLAPAILFGIGIWIYGFAVLRMADKQQFTGEFKVAILQPDIDQYKKWDEKYEKWIISQLMWLLEEASKFSPELVVWPESALPGWIEDPVYHNWVSSLAVNMKAMQLVGSISGEGGKHVSAMLFDTDGQLAGEYNKRKLVPFGEYVPFRKFLGSFITPISKLGEFEPGAGKQQLLHAGNKKLGVTICYESIFPYLVSASADSGADILVNMTNDGWYLNTAGPYQHLLINIFRAVENRKPLVRAANTGISAWIDPWGRVQNYLAIDNQGVLYASIPDYSNLTPASYSSFGDWFTQFCLMVFAAYFIAVLVL